MSRNDGWRGSGHVFRRTAGPDRPAGKIDDTPRGLASPPVGIPEFGEDDVDPAELEEFMSSDWLDVKADPSFRERLRERLWNMLRERNAPPAAETAGGGEAGTKRRTVGPRGRD